jgi:hypothetical protein
LISPQCHRSAFNSGYIVSSHAKVQDVVISVEYLASTLRKTGSPAFKNPMGVLERALVVLRSGFFQASKNFEGSCKSEKPLKNP